MQLHLFIYMLSSATFELQSSCNNDSVGHKTENICYLALYWENLLTCGVNDHPAKYLFILIPRKVNGWWLWLLFLFSHTSYITEPGGFS